MFQKAFAPLTAFSQRPRQFSQPRAYGGPYQVAGRHCGEPRRQSRCAHIQQVRNIQVPLSSHKRYPKPLKEIFSAGLDITEMMVAGKPDAQAEDRVFAFWTTLQDLWLQL